MEDSTLNLKILSELKDYIVSLSKEEYNTLEKNILQQGCRDPLVVWKNEGGMILVDGHNRYKICLKHNLPFNLSIVEFDDIDDVKLWMLNNQIGRRNLTSDQLSYYRGLKYLSLRNRKGGIENVLSKGQNEPSTSELVAQEFKVSGSTVKRDAKYAEGLNILARSNPDLKNKILKGEVKVKKNDLQLLTNIDDKRSLSFKNETDLYNQIEYIKNDLLTKIESRVEEIDSKREDDAREVFNAIESPFQSKEDRIQKIKGRIISAINRAVNNQDVEAIDDLKTLIKKLEVLLFNN